MAQDHEKKPIKDREMPGYGYDKSLDDLKVIGKNRNANKGEEQIRSHTDTQSK